MMPTNAFQPGQNIPIPTIPNLRDLGGWATPTGKVRRGLLYRSAEFSKLAGEDAAAFGTLGIRSVYDFRTEPERAAQPNVVPAGVEYVVLDILADSTNAAPAQILKVLGDPKGAQELLGGNKAAAMFEAGYREIVSLSSALTGYRQFFTDIGKKEHRPAVFHCTTGKDRTGWGAAALLLLLGVGEEDVYRDYLLTNALLPAMQPMIEKFTSIGGDPDLLTPVLGVAKPYLAAGITEMQTKFGTIDGYFSAGLGLDRATIENLKTTYVEVT